MKTLAFLLFFSGIVFAQEKHPRLQEILKEKQALDQQAERGQLLIENARLRFERLIEEEKRIIAEQQKARVNEK